MLTAYFIIWFVKGVLLKWPRSRRYVPTGLVKKMLYSQSLFTIKQRW